MGEKTFHVSVTSSSQGINVKPESGGQSINTTVSVTSQKNININAATKQNPIGATSDTGLYYSQLSKNWAIGDGLIQNEDYSSKTWAAESKSSADLSKMYSEAASLDYNNLSDTINQYNEQISGVVAEGINTIETTKTEASEYVETTANESIAEVNQAKEQAIKDFNKASDKVNYLFVMPIGTIGFSPFPIDETKGLRRILNGQLIIQEQFTGFVKWLKENTELYPQMACTEAEWQTTVTMSTFGQCGKFVIDDEAGTIRLPKITGFIQGLTDLASLGELVEGRLPGITTKTTTTTNIKVTVPNTGWTVTGSALGTATKGTLLAGTGAGEKGETLESINATSATRAATVTQGATSTSTSTYNDNTVQPEAIRYPYFIQVATGAEESVDVTREIELNNPFFFGYYQYFETAPNNISWLKSEGQWNAKAIYTDYYDWILTNANNGVANFKLSTDTYDDYAWVVNTADETFRLPLKTNNLNNSVDSLSLYFYVGETVQNANLINAGRIEEVVVGKVNRTGDTMTGSLGIKPFSGAGYVDFCRSNIDLGYVPSEQTNLGGIRCFARDITGNTYASIIQGYIGVANSQSTTGIQFITRKPDNSGWGAAMYLSTRADGQAFFDFPKCTTKATTTSSASSSKVAVITQNYVSGTSWYRVWSDGWIEQGGVVTLSTANSNITVKLLKTHSNANYTINFSYREKDNTTGDSWWPYINATPSSSSFRVRNSTGNTACKIYWETKGY